MPRHESNTNNELMIDENKKSSKGILVSVVVGIMLFGLGVGVGNGQVSVGQNFSSISSNSDLPEDLDYSEVDAVYDALRENYDGELDLQALTDSLKEGIARATGDPFTEFLNPESAEEFSGGLSGTFSGIGAELSKKDNLITVVSPISGFPAEAAGLRSQDVIIEIDGESAFDISVTDAVGKIRGPEGTTVKLKVLRGGSEQIDLEITRQQITIPSVESEILEGNIGYLKVSRFGEDTAKLSRDAADQFKSAGVTGVILDLRSNPGGLLGSSVELSSIWLPRGATVLEEKREGETIQTYEALGNPVLLGIPTVVLINEGSASASEIVAGALKDNNAASTIGAKTFGKGSVQSLINLGDGSILKVTIARWFTPNGLNIDQEGISPDKEVELTEEDFLADRDPQRDAAIESLR